MIVRTRQAMQQSAVTVLENIQDYFPDPDSFGGTFGS
jgi:hypothetical protein